MNQKLHILRPASSAKYAGKSGTPPRKWAHVIEVTGSAPLISTVCGQYALEPSALDPLDDGAPGEACEQCLARYYGALGFAKATLWRFSSRVRRAWVPGTDPRDLELRFDADETPIERWPA